MNQPEPTPIKPEVKIEMGRRKSGLSAPKEAVDVCRHEEVLERLKPRLDKYMCGDCTEQVLMVVINFSLMTQEVFDEFQKRQAAAFEAARRKQTTGLVTPDEARQQQGQEKGPPRRRA